MYDKIRTTLFPLITALIWGSTYVVQSAYSPRPLSFNCMRAFVATVFLLLVLLVFTKGDVKHLLRGKDRKETLNLWLGGMLSGMSLACVGNLQQFGLSNGVEAGKAGFITALYIVLVPLLGIFLKKKVTANVWIAVALALVGQYFIFVKNDFSVNLNDLFIFGAAFMSAVHILIVDHFTAKCHPIKMSCIQVMTMSVISLVLACVFENPQPSDLTNNIFPILYVGLGSSGIAYTLQVVAQKDANPTIITLLLSLEAVFSVIAGAIFLHEVLTGREYLGCALMFIAVLLAQFDIFEMIRARKAKKSAVTEENAEISAQNQPDETKAEA